MISRRQVLAAGATAAATWALAGSRAGGQTASGVLQAGAAAIDITPAEFPVIVNGGFTERTADKVHDPLFARALVLQRGDLRLAIVLVDNCLMPRDLLDAAKQLIAAQSNIPVQRVLISATHCHSGPSVMGALGSRPDQAYVKVLPGKIAEAVAKAISQLEPAQAGWGRTSFEFTACRRWIRRADRIGTDPFGEKTVRAMMHPGRNNPDYICPSGAVDYGLPMLSVQATDGRPIALVVNYSMHYFGAPAISPDYFGLFAATFPRLAGAQDAKPPMVAMLTHGTSGDQWYGDYSKPPRKWTIQEYTEQFSQRVLEAYRKIEHRRDVDLAMAETELTLHRRQPSADRLAWARELAGQIGKRLPRNQPEVYALEQLHLAANPTACLRLQAIRVGEFAVAAIPCEVYGLTGLKLKALSPASPTMVIELANGAEGYIPPPEQHVLGGYNTWPARSAGLEVQAEPKIVQAVLGLLEKVTLKPRRELPTPDDAYARAVLADKPEAYWPLDDMSAIEARDVSGHKRPARYEGGLAMYLEGPSAGGQPGRATHFAGGLVRGEARGLGRDWAVEAWVWNGLPADAHDHPTWLMQVGTLRVGLDGKAGGAGKLLVSAEGTTLRGKTSLTGQEWHHVMITVRGTALAVYLDGREQADLTGPLPKAAQAEQATVVLGGCADDKDGLEGRLAHVALYAHAMAGAEAARHFRAK